MIYHQTKAVITLLLVFIVNHSFSQNTKQIDSLFSEMYQKGEFNGNVVLSKKGEILLQKSYGYSDFETKEPLTEQSVFNLASVTKQFTAAALVLLNRSGKLNYTDHIQKHIPELSFYPPITIKNLLTHTSGLPDYMQLADSLVFSVDSSAMLDNDQVIQLLAKYQPELNFEPNSKFEYSNTGYVLLASIIERVSNQKFDVFIQENIFKPLRLDDTQVLYRYAENTETSNLTKAYQEDEFSKTVDALEAAPTIKNLDWVCGQGRLYSTSTDLLNWSNALSNGFFSNDEWQLICSTNQTSANKQVNYGFGWFITQDIIHGKSVYHSGSWPGYITYIEKNLEQDITLIILQNLSTSKSHLPTYLLRQCLYSTPAVDLNDSYLKSLAGNYKTESGKTKAIEYANGKLYAVMNPEFKLELIPRTRTIFKIDGFNPEVNFEFFFEDQQVKGYRFYQLDLGIEAVVNKTD